MGENAWLMRTGFLVALRVCADRADSTSQPRPTSLKAGAGMFASRVSVPRVAAGARKQRASRRVALAAKGDNKTHQRQAQKQEKKEVHKTAQEPHQDYNVGGENCPLPQAVLNQDMHDLLCGQTEWCSTPVWCDSHEHWTEKSEHVEI